MTLENGLCKAHSGVCHSLKTMEGDVTELQKKWESMQKLLIGILVGVSMNLIGVLIAIFHKG